MPAEKLISAGTHSSSVDLYAWTPPEMASWASLAMMSTTATDVGLVEVGGPNRAGRLDVEGEDL